MSGDFVLVHTYEKKNVSHQPNPLHYIHVCITEAWGGG